MLGARNVISNTGEPVEDSDVDMASVKSEGNHEDWVKGVSR